MKSSKNIRLPFFFVTSLSMALMAIIIYARYQADKSITSLRKGNLNAVNVFKVHVLRDEIIDGIYTIDFGIANLNATKDATNLKDTLEKIKTNLPLLDSLIAITESEATGRKFIRLVNEKIKSYNAVLLDTYSPQSLQNFNARTDLLTDSIYFSAIELEDKLSDYLQKNIADNENLAIKVSQIDLRLTFIIIGAIAILATIIILRLLQNFQLLKAFYAERLEAEKAARVKEQFLANMSHEIRTPINSVVGFTNLLQKTDLKPEQQQYVSLITTAGQNLLSIVNDILDISKIEAGMLHFDKSPFSIREVCYNIEMLFQHKAKDKKLFLKTHVTDDVPELLLGDKERLTQVLMNLTSNAVKFTAAGGVYINVHCKKFSTSDVTLGVEVKDTGIGIKEDKLNVIFERFEQAETDTTIKYGGTGLGLAIVKSLVTMQGGKLNVLSEEGKGSVFEFEINYEIYKQKNPSPPATGSEVKAVLIPHPAFEGKTVLVAEDNKMNQLLLKKIFQQLQLKAAFATDGAQAVELLKNHHYDLILMDIQMPVMDGYTATQEIRKTLQQAIPIIAMTAKVLPGEKEKCIAAGMNDYISKPIDETSFYNVLVKTLSVGTARPNAPCFISTDYLNNMLAGDTQSLIEIMSQFIKQYPQEIQLLAAAINEHDYDKVKRLSHLMQTTVRTVSNASTLYPHLLNIENAAAAENTESIQESFAAIIYTEPFVMQQARDILANASGSIKSNFV